MDDAFNLGWLMGEDDDPGEALPFYAQVTIVTLDQAPLLRQDRLARIVTTTLDTYADRAPGRLWAYTVLPESVRLVVGPADEHTLDAFITTFKTVSHERLMDVVRRADDESIDAVLRYNPVWGGVIFQVWQAGYHRQVFLSEYKLSNAILSVLQAPVEAGLVEQIDDWPHRWVETVEE